jgi:voltage-gated potassium channel
MKFIKNYLFLISLIVVMLMDPFLEDFSFGNLITLCLLSISATLCIMVLSSQKSIHWFLISISVFVVGINVILQCSPSETSYILQYISLAILLFLYAILLFHLMMSSTTLSRQDISNAIAIYLLIGIGFGFIYSLIEKIYPGAIVFQTQGNKEISGDMIYFSFVTLTTAGFGDMLAVHKYAKIAAMMEAVTGVLYIAVTIGRLIGIHPGKSENKLEL